MAMGTAEGALEAFQGALPKPRPDCLPACTSCTTARGEDAEDDEDDETAADGEGEDEDEEGTQSAATGVTRQWKGSRVFGMGGSTEEAMRCRMRMVSIKSVSQHEQTTPAVLEPVHIDHGEYSRSGCNRGGMASRFGSCTAC